MTPALSPPSEARAEPRVLSVIPPMTQLNTPYPSTAYLTGFLRSRGIGAVQEDLALALVLALFSPAGLREMAASDPGLTLIELPANGGKGAAVLHGLQAARAAGFTHALTMDSDGQHPAELIPAFMQTSLRHPDTMVLGRPVFDASAPLLRVRGRRVSNWWTNLETLGAGIDDSLYGFRVYPIPDLIAVMQRQQWMRRFDFDTEAVVRLAWRGVKPLNLAAPVRYLTAAEGGVSHFQYGRDNVLLTWMHARLMLEFALRLPSLVWRRMTRQAPFQRL